MIFTFPKTNTIAVSMGSAIHGIQKNNQRPETVTFNSSDLKILLQEEPEQIKRYLILLRNALSYE